MWCGRRVITAERRVAFDPFWNLICFLLFGVGVTLQKHIVENVGKQSRACSVVFVWSHRVRRRLRVDVASNTTVYLVSGPVPQRAHFFQRPRTIPDKPSESGFDLMTRVR